MLATVASSQQVGSIRGMVYDADFEVPLGAARVAIRELDQTSEATDQGNYYFGEIPAGSYTLVFSKQGYVRQVRTDVVVSPGRMTEVDASLSGEFTEMEQFVVRPLEIGGGSEEALQIMRMESPDMMDFVSADQIGKSGHSDVAKALTLVSGTTVQDGKYAVVRGLPDRYVNSQMNRVRLPTADAEKRAVQLDQFPTAVVESIRVSKTFTPDQQGDASGGAVNVVLKGIPDEAVLKFSSGTSFNSQVWGADDFLTYRGGGTSFWARDDSRDIPPFGDFGGAVGTDTEHPALDYSWSLTAGGKHDLESGLRIGALSNLYYKRDSEFYDNGVDDSYWVESPGGKMVPQRSLDSGGGDDFITSLFDVKQGVREVQWGWLGTFGVEIDNHALNVAYMLTRIATDTAILAEDTRGKQYFFPDYDPYDSTDPGNADLPDKAPYHRSQTLKYTERTTETLQFNGRHTLPIPEVGVEGFLVTRPPELDWTVALSSATLHEPDKRQFASVWRGPAFRPGFPPFVPPSTSDAEYRALRPAANTNLGNFQRIWKDIEEESTQYFTNITFPFEQWSGSEGYLKLGLFHDEVDRTYEQESFHNTGAGSASYRGSWEELWSDVFPLQGYDMEASDVDVDYQGTQEISAWYYMADLPVTSWLNVVGGARYETTELEITNDAEKDVTWLPPGATGPVKLTGDDADKTFRREDILPSIGLVLTPMDKLKLRGSYSETVARQTFKEMTPIQQQEFLGGDIFIGNPNLDMSSLKNIDLRADYTPYPGGFFSLSFFHKDVTDPIEYVQGNAGFTFTTPVNYPEGKIDGVEFEVRQRLGEFWPELEGLSIGGNATFIDSEVTLPREEAERFLLPQINAPMTTREMTGAPEHLYNINVTYDIEETGTQLGLFYTVQGDTLVAGAGQASGKFVPSIYATEYGTLNFSLSQKLGEHWTLKFAAKNLTNPEIEEVYRSRYIDSDVTRSSYRKGIDFSFGISGEWRF